jgi:subtilisin family serine protease
MRKKYRQTNGADGAFIVATNLSGGVNFAFAQDHPLWCEMYDKLGAEGILSVCAAPNNGISVDVDGDMPTTCSSPYMIAVTNVDLTDELLSNAGYGATSIDIGAPGHGTITIASGNQYKEFPGTSSATPHVTGAVALMYSTPCSSFLGDLQNDPSAMAEKVRNLIFATAKSNNSLKEITVTGKRLQVDAALKATAIDCGPVMTSGVQILYIRPNLVHLEDIQAFFEVKGDTSTAYFELYNATGARVYHYPITDAEFGQKYLTIDASPLAAGVYFLTLRNKKEKSTRKFVVY